MFLGKEYQSRLLRDAKQGCFPSFVTPHPLGTEVNLGKVTEGQRELVDKIATQIEKDLFYWKSFSVDLPSSKFINPQTNERKVKRKKVNLFRSPPSLDELNTLAQVNGQQVPLNPEQLAQIRETGHFKVPSQLFPGKHHEWKLTALLASGNQNHRKLFYSCLSTALYVISFVPTSIISTTPVSIYSAFTQIPALIKDLASVLIGIPETKLWKPMKELLEYRRLEFVYREFKSQLLEWRENVERSPDRVPPSSGIFVADIDGKSQTLDARLLDSRLFSMVDDHLSDIIEDVSRQWMKERHAFIRTCLESVDDSQDSDTLEAIIKRKCQDEFDDRVYTTLQNDKELNRLGGEGMSDLLEAKFRIWRLLTQFEEDIAEENTVVQREIVKSIKEEHPIRSLTNVWYQEEVERRLDTALGRKKTGVDSLNSRNYQRFIQQLELYIRSIEGSGRVQLAQKLEQEMYLICRDYEWCIKYQSNAKTWIQQNMKVPARVHMWKARIFFKRNYTVTRNDTNYCQHTTETLTVNSDTWCWRWKILFVRSWVWFKNTAAGCRYSLLDSPLSLKTLFKVSPFPYYGFNRKTGQMEVAGYHATICSAIRDIWRDAMRSRAQFERQPDTGFIGKSLTRYINIFWNYIMKCGIGIPLSMLITTPIVLLSNACSVLVLLASPLLGVLGSILRFLLNILVYDIDGVRWCRVLPLFSIVIGRGIFGFVGQIVLSLLLSILIIPGISSVVLLYGTVVSSGRYFYDWLMYHLIVKRRARIPKTDSFSARRVSGPGLQKDYYYQIGTEDALAIIQLELELQELSIFEDSMRLVITLPKKLFKKYFRDVFRVFGLSGGDNKTLNESTKKWEALLQKRLKQRRQDLPLIDSVPLHLIRLSGENLQELLEHGEELVYDFVENRIFKDLFHSSEELISRYWANCDIQEGDWNELTRYYITRSFSSQLLEPLADSDCSVRLETRNTATVKNFVQMIRKKELADDLERKGVTITTVPPSLLSSLLKKTQFSVDLNHLKLYSSAFCGNLWSLSFLRVGKKNSLNRE